MPICCLYTLSSKREKCVLNYHRYCLIHHGESEEVFAIGVAAVLAAMHCHFAMPLSNFSTVTFPGGAGFLAENASCVTE